MIIFTPNTIIKSTEVNSNFAEVSYSQNLTNAYMFKAYRNADVSLTDNTASTIVYNAELFDTNNNFDTTTGEYTVPVTGYYCINASAIINGGTGAAYLWAASIDLLVNNITSDTDTLYVYDQGRFTYSQFRISGIYYLTAGQKVKVRAGADTANGSNWVITGNRSSTVFSGFFVSK